MSYIDYLEWRFRNLNEGLSFLLAILSLAVAFIKLRYFYFGAPAIVIGILIPIIAAAIAVVPHEIAHRQTARVYGCNSRFILSFKGFLATLLINLLSRFTGVLVFVSGFTGIFCRFGLMSKDVEGKTAFAGPATNLAIAVISILLLLTLRPTNAYIDYLLSQTYEFNSYVAFFNLIPIPPLDGQKVMKWNIGIWVASIIFSLILAFMPFFIL